MFIEIINFLFDSAICSSWVEKTQFKMRAELSMKVKPSALYYNSSQ